MSDAIVDIIKDVTSFFSYFAPGYVFLSCYCFSGYLEREKQIEYLVVKCISISYILLVISQWMGRNKNWSELAIQSVSLIIAIILGLILGELRRLPWVNEWIFDFVNRELSNSIFADLCEMGKDKKAVVYLFLTLKNNKGFYEGQLNRTSSYNGEPALKLVFYKHLGADGREICDCSEKDDTGAVIFASDIENFEYEIIPMENDGNSGV